MGNLNINNPKVIRGRPFSSCHYTEAAKQILNQIEIMIKLTATQ